MTHQELRDLLHDQVDDLEAFDLAAGVWREAVRRRRRGRLAAAGVTVLATALVVAGVAVVRDRLDQAPDGAPAPAGPPPWVTERVEGPAADTSYQDLPVWWSPDLDEELELPWIDDSPLPRHLDLTVDLPELGTTGIPFDRAIAAFGRDDVVVLVDGEGQVRRVTIDLPPPADDPDGNPTARFGPSMLSADGRSLEVRQGDDRAVLDIGATTWRTSAGSAEATPGPMVLQLPPAMQNPAGTVHVNDEGASAQGWGMGPGIPVRDPARYLSGPSYLVTTGGPAGTSVLAFMTGFDDVRWLDGPTVAGWLDDDTVVYESVAEDRDLLVAWDVDTSTFRRVMSVTPGWQSSFARLS